MRLLLVAGDADAIIHAQTGRGRRGHHGEVALRKQSPARLQPGVRARPDNGTHVLGSEHDEGPGQRLQAFRLHARVLPVAGREHRVQIGYSSTCAFNSRQLRAAERAINSAGLVPGARMESPPL